MFTGLLVLASCGGTPPKPVEDLGSGRDLSRFTLTSLKGTRDGDRLDVRALYGDDTESLTVELHFRVTPPTRLESGDWKGFGAIGQVHERSSTFLGGQSAAPSIGGRFDLLDPGGKPLYRIAIPLQPLNQRL